MTNSNNNTNIESLLQELEKETGLSLRLEGGEEEQNAVRLQNLLSRVRTNGSRNEAFLRYLTGLLSENEARSLLLRSKKDDPMLDMYLFHFTESLEDNPGILSVLTELVDASTTEFLQNGAHEILLLRTVDQIHTSEELHEFAAFLSDTLMAEAMTAVHISFDHTAESFSQLPTSYQHLRAAMEIGQIFYSSEQIYDYHSLGLGKLVASVPREAALEFLSEELPGIHFNEFDAETRNTIEVFFESGLNIAEAARILYLHRNTLVYRLDKFYKTTGKDLRNFDDAVQIRIGMLLSQASEQ